jgi:hypothetical protein
MRWFSHDHVKCWSMSVQTSTGLDSKLSEGVACTAQWCMQAHIEPPPSLWAHAAMPRSQLLHRIPDSRCLNHCFRFDRDCVPNSVRVVGVAKPSGWLTGRHGPAGEYIYVLKRCLGPFVGCNWRIFSLVSGMSGMGINTVRIWGMESWDMKGESLGPSTVSVFLIGHSWRSQSIVSAAPHIDLGSKDRGHEWEIIITAVLETFNVFAGVGHMFVRLLRVSSALSPDGCNMSPCQFLYCELVSLDPQLEPTVSLMLLNDDEFGQARGSKCRTATRLSKGAANKRCQGLGSVVRPGP